MKGLSQLMKQAQQMQANLEKAQAELESILVDGEAGAGMIRVTMSCKYHVKKVQIEDSLLEDDKDMLEDLIAAAFNDANRKVEARVQEHMSSVTGDMSLPPGMKLPF